ncbi:MAG: glycosyltransferase family 2 protein [Methylococcaceae bacterium]|nr:glycosyltransferase family 2 protein [Methylococcaceae bacterium]
MLSVIIITKNESRNICRCLDSVAWADELIVLDSGSDDDTVALCLRYTEQVFETDWPGFGLQKQRALKMATGDWVLSLDADEWLTAELTAEIQQAITQSEIDGYWIPRLSSYCGKDIRHGGWWPDYVLRLFQRNRGRFTDNPVHERIIIDGKTDKLSMPILHEAFIDPEEVLHKINHYSSLGAEKLYQAGKRTCLIQAILKGLWSFFRTYCLKAAFLDGQEGLMLSISNAEGTYYKYLKLLNLQKKKGRLA